MGWRRTQSSQQWEVLPLRALRAGAILLTGLALSACGPLTGSPSARLSPAADQDLPARMRTPDHATPTPSPGPSSALPTALERPAAGAGFNSTAPPAIPGYRRVYTETFDAPHTDERWGRYGWGDQRPGHGGMGRYDVNNVTVEAGSLNLRYRYHNNEWTSAGVSGAPSYSASRGRWEVRAKFPRGQGLSFAFLLWPEDDDWPPEVDFLEGGCTNTLISAFYHDGQPKRRWDAQMPAPDLTQWHTYGVILEDNQITYTLDGQPWGSVRPTRVTREKLWIAVQTAAISPTSYEARWHMGGVPQGVPNPRTPAESAIRIDWVAHYLPQ